MTDAERLTPWASILSFVATAVLATAAATGLFVLLDPRAQAFWGTRSAELVNAVRGLLGLR